MRFVNYYWVIEMDGLFHYMGGMFVRDQFYQHTGGFALADDTIARNKPDFDEIFICRLQSR